MIDPSWKIAFKAGPRPREGSRSRFAARENPVTNRQRNDATGTSYFARREAQERVLLARAKDPAARIAHEELAKRYAELNREPEPA